MRKTIQSSLLASALGIVFTSNALAQTATPPASLPPQAPAPPAAPAPAPTTPAPSTAAFPAAASAPAAPPPAPGPSPAAAAPAPRRTAVVRFNSDEPGAVLESDTTSDGRSVAWYVVCEAPCTSRVDQGASFRVGGYGFHDSRLFRLPQERSEFAVAAEMERSSIAFPMAITIVGGVVASIGGSMVLSGWAEEQDYRDGEDLITTGSIVGGVGLLVATVGVVMLIVDSQHNESRAHVAKRLQPLAF
jgi:hypothetical protein